MSEGSVLLHVADQIELADQSKHCDRAILLGNIPSNEEEKSTSEPQLSLSEQWALEFSRMPLEDQTRLQQSLLPKRTKEEEEKRAQAREAAGVTTFRRLSFDFVPADGDVVPRFPVSLNNQVTPVDEKQALSESLKLSPEELQGLEDTKACIYFDFYRLMVQIVSMFKPVVIICCLIFIYVRVIRIPWEETRSLAIWSILVYNPHPRDTVGEEAVGSIYNGLLVLAFVVCVTAMYVVLLVNNMRNVLLRILQGLNIVLLGGPFAYFVYQILVVYNIPLDALTFTGCVWNVIGVGWFALNYNGNSKTYLTRGYLILLAICMAWPFVEFPEPSMWATLALLVVYDLFAVLAPCGPLRYIMEAEAKLKREGKDAKPLPGLVYRGHYFIVGVGDLVFYGALMGQASVLGWETGLGCLIGILMGVAGTILWTTSSGKLATPALPISAVLGLCLRFATPALVVPMCRALSLHSFFL